jgi:hypothetical protein
MRHTLATLALLTMVVAGACAGDATAGTSAAPSLAATPAPSASPSAIPTMDPEGELCLRVGEMEMRLAELQTVELTLPNRTSLEVELDKLEAAYIELERVDLGQREDELEDSLKRLGYRMGEVKLAVEDFRTNPKPKRAAPHVEEDSQKVADELNAFVILSRC